jgi:hypothetical protein
VDRRRFVATPGRSDDRAAGALALLEGHRRELDKLSKRLLEARELERVDIVSVLG